MPRTGTLKIRKAKQLKTFWRQTIDQKVRNTIFSAVTKEPFAKARKINLVKLGPSHSVAEMAYDPGSMNNIYEHAHGGALLAMIDEAFETASQTDGTIAVVLNVNVTYVSSPEVGVKLRAEAKRVSQTKKTAS